MTVPAPQLLRITFSKLQGARFLSHLDLMATFEYAVRRAGLPIKLSEGFNPRPRLSLAAPLPVGYVGEREVLELSLHSPLAPAEVRVRLQATLPSGLLIRDVDVVQQGEKPAASRLRSATYRVELPATIADLPRRVASLLAEPSLPVREERAGRARQRDLRPFVLRLEAVDGATIRLVAALGPTGTVRPDQILPLLRISPDGATITREYLDLAEPAPQSGSDEATPGLR